MGEILDAFLESFDADETKRCGPRCGHWKDIQELERLRSLIYEWVEADRNERRHYPPPRADAQIRRIKAEEALRKAVER